MSIMDAFQEQDCQKAAVFMGALMHVIGDATFYGHLLEGIPSGGYNTIWAHVDHVAYKTWNDGDRITEFFNLNEARNKLSVVLSNSPWLATIYSGMDTFYGTSVYKDANFLYQFQPNAVNHSFWADIEGYWNVNNEYDQELTWTHSDRPPNAYTNHPDAIAYFDTLEHNLNTAVYYCATALYYIITYGGYTDCGCSGENPPQDQGSSGGDKDEEAVREGVQLTLDQFLGLFYFNVIGLVSTALALTLTSKLLDQILEKIIPIW